jgi:hypothetical protein
MRPIEDLVVVHRLRKVSCLYGFRRFEAAPSSADGELEDIRPRFAVLRSASERNGCRP